MIAGQCVSLSVLIRTKSRYRMKTSILQFRHLMERNNLGDELSRLVNVYLSEHGITINRGTIVDVTIISAPSSTKNKTKTRDSDMQQTRKGNQWYFWMKTYIGADSKTKLIHSIVVTPANCHDSQVLGDLGCMGRFCLYGTKRNDSRDSSKCKGLDPKERLS